MGETKKAGTKNTNNKVKKEKDWGTFQKIILGILIGIGLATVFTFLYRTWWLNDYIGKDVVPVKCDSTKEAMIQSVQQLQILNASFAEKIEALNKRLDDFLVFGGMVITLLLAITISVYLKTESEVSKHMNKYAEDIDKDIIKNKEAIEKYLTQAAQLVQEIESKKDAATEELNRIQAKGKQV